MFNINCNLGLHQTNLHVWNPFFFPSSSVSLYTRLQSRACLSALMSWDLSQVCIFALLKAHRDKGRKHPSDPIWPWQFSAPFHPSKRCLVLPDSCLHYLHDGKCMLEMFSDQHVFFFLFWSVFFCIIYCCKHFLHAVDLYIM